MTFAVDLAFKERQRERQRECMGSGVINFIDKQI